MQEYTAGLGRHERAPRVGSRDDTSQGPDYREWGRHPPKTVSLNLTDPRTCVQRRDRVNPQKYLGKWGYDH